MKQVMTKFGSLKIDNGEDIMMSADAIHYSDDFVPHLTDKYRFFIVKTNWKALEP